MPESDICRKCQKPKTSASSGLVTQFIDVCQCDVIAVEQSQTITICSTCNMRIAKNVGSMTQWIFGQGKCECDKPQPTDTPIEEFINPSFVGFRDSGNETYLDLDSEKFPIERYLPIAELGKGASGVVYLCRDKVLSKKVAVKTLLDLNPDQLISFQDEAKATAKLDHPNIIRILDFGASESGTPYMVMDYVPGISLEDYLKKYGTLQEENARVIFSKLAEALDYAHNQNVFHRDLKPSNILLHETDEEINVTLIDFGIAKVKESTGMITMYQKRTLAGTPAYMSPDVIRGENYDSQSEIYSLGCVLFEALIGEPPFKGETPLETLAMHANNNSPVLDQLRAESDKEIWNILEKCLSKSKDDRFGSMKELGEGLMYKEVQSAEPNKLLIDSTPIQQKTDSRLLFIAIAAFSLLVVAWSFYQFSQFLRPESSSQYQLGRDDPGYYEKLSNPEIVKIEKGKYGIISFNRRTIESLDSINQQEDLVELEFSNTKLDYDLLKRLRKYPLQSIKLHNVEISAKSIKSFRKILTLKYLTVDQINIGPELAKALRMLSLSQLSIIDCRLAPTTINELSRSSANILIGSPFSKLQESALKEMPKMTNLKYLIVWHNRVNNETLPKILAIKSLKKLSIRSGWTVVSTSVKELSQLPHLDTLFWRDHKIKTPADLVHIKNLKVLGIESISNRFLKIAPKLKIEKLVVYSSTDSNDMLLRLASIDTLRVLEIKSSPQRSEKFITQFNSLKKDCIVKFLKSQKTLFGSAHTNLVDEMNEVILDEHLSSHQPLDSKSSAQELIMKQINLEEGITKE